MRELTPEEEKYLVKYCMESKENTWLALAIGHIQVQLRAKILSSFLKKLDKNVRKKLEACGRLRQWKTKVIETKVIETNLIVQGKRTGLKVQGKEKIIYEMTMEDQEIKIYLGYWENIFVGTPAANEACPTAKDLSDYFQDTGLILTPANSWRWQSYLQDSHKSFDDLCTLHDDELRQEKIEHFTYILVLSAKAISESLEE